MAVTSWCSFNHDRKGAVVGMIPDWRRARKNALIQSCHALGSRYAEQSVGEITNVCGPQLLEALFACGLVVDSSPSTRHRAMMILTTIFAAWRSPDMAESRALVAFACVCGDKGQG